VKYDPTIHHRRSIRLRDYDYSQCGAYFITICVRGRRCIFGEVQGGEMHLNPCGQIAYDEWENLPHRWPHLELGAFQIMPNHLHGILIIRDVRTPLAGAPAGLDGLDAADGQPRGLPLLRDILDAADGLDGTNAPTVRVPLAGTPDAPDAPTVRVPLAGTLDAPDAPTVRVPLAGTLDAPDGQPQGLPLLRDTQMQWRAKPTMGQIVGAYKSCVIHQCLQKLTLESDDFHFQKMWQRNFWEHIIRDVTAFDNISEYIINNPAKWKKDKFYGR
jgi:putative transposase